MWLCVPTLCNYDGVDALIRSAEAGIVKPTGYAVLDNGGEYTRARFEVAIGARPVSRALITPGKNLGVAASWNVFLEQFGKTAPIVISNDDILLGQTAFAKLLNHAHSGTHRAGFGWALFMQSPECTQRVGHYDENFWPAYYEDIDYIIRMERAGVPDIRLEGNIDIQHSSWTTTNMLGDPSWLADGRARNHSYLVAKWGTNSSLTSEAYKSPFNGAPPPGWTGLARLPGLPLHWELLNQIADMIGAERCLVLGPAGRPLDLPTVYVAPLDTNQWFAVNPGERFDLIFIDGDHTLAQVDRDIDNALRSLTPKGVIVLHDCSPFYEDMQVVPHNGSHYWTGDVWRSILRLRLESQHAVCVVDSDFGLGIVIPGRPEAVVMVPPQKDITYQNLLMHRKALLGLVSGWEWREWFTEAYAERHVQPPPLPEAEMLQASATLRVNLGCSNRLVEGYVNVDLCPPADLVADLTERWPWADGTVDEVRAFDLIEHLPDKIHTMNEAWRVLRPGGLFHIFVPTTDGRGAFQDPTHTSYWNRNSFWYYEHGNDHRELAARSYGVLASFAVESETDHHFGSGIEHLEIRLRAVKP